MIFKYPSSEISENALDLFVGKFPRQIGQGDSPTKDPTLSSCQSRAAPAPRQVAHSKSNSAKMFSSNGGTESNGYYCFIRV